VPQGWQRYPQYLLLLLLLLLLLQWHQQVQV
jgi:hypothetical protein